MRHAALTTPVTIIPLLAVAMPAFGAEIEGKSSIEQVPVYPDGATVPRIIRPNLPAGDTPLIARDFPPTLDPSSLRIEGEAQGRLVIGAIDARPPRAERP